MDVRVMLAANQFHAGDEVAPLIVPAHLHGAVVRLVEMQVVNRLDNHVAELGVRDALIGSSSRLRTKSFAIIALTEKCLPMSRRYSNSVILPSQSALFTMMAALSPSNER